VIILPTCPPIRSVFVLEKLARLGQQRRLCRNANTQLPLPRHLSTLALPLQPHALTKKPEVAPSPQSTVSTAMEERQNRTPLLENSPLTPSERIGDLESEIVPFLHPLPEAEKDGSLPLEAPKAPSENQRLVSLDVFRGLTIAVCFFQNFAISSNFSFIMAKLFYGVFGVRFSVCLWIIRVVV